jgi:hypothetical protein
MDQKVGSAVAYGAPPQAAASHPLHAPQAQAQAQAQGQQQQRRYVALKVLGQGAFGTVICAKDVVTNTVWPLWTFVWK